MRTRNPAFRTLAYLLVAATMVFTLAACGGGGGGGTSSTSPGVAGPATVGVSIASAPDYPAGTTFAPSTTALSPVAAAPPVSPSFDNVLVTVTKLALIPSTGPEYPDGNGELERTSSEDPDKPGFVTVAFDPVVIDLKNLSPDNAATLLNRFPAVPAGEYSKIRVYYEKVVGMPGDVVFHQTGNYHFDVHFVGGNLVIPETSDSEGGIRFYSVVIDVVGLKYHQAGNSNNILLRPQVFATVGVEPRYIVSGLADQVNHSDSTFVVLTVNDNVSAAYGPLTKWYYADGRNVGPFPSDGVSGVDALRDTAIVDVIGTFQSGELAAERVYITFPSVIRDEKVYQGWTDNTIVLRFSGDNVVSLPGGLRNTAYYDNAIDSSYARLTGTAIDTAIVDNVTITARGYAVPGGIEAFWISVGEVAP